MQAPVHHAPAAQAEPAEIQELDRQRAAGWSYFTRFLTLNVITCAAALIAIAIVTVWS